MERKESLENLPWAALTPEYIPQNTKTSLFELTAVDHISRSQAYLISVRFWSICYIQISPHFRLAQKLAIHCCAKQLWSDIIIPLGHEWVGSTISMQRSCLPSSSKAVFFSNNCVIPPIYFALAFYDTFYIFIQWQRGSFPK